MFVEIGIALASLASYAVIDYLPVYGSRCQAAYNHLDLYGLSIVRLLLSVIVLLPPVFLIGGTMPLVTKYALTASTTMGAGFSRIYYVNTLGAFAGALLTGFVLVKYFGVLATLMIAVAGNFLVAAIIGLGKSVSGPGCRHERIDEPVLAHAVRAVPDGLHQPQLRSPLGPHTLHLRPVDVTGVLADRGWLPARILSSVRSSSRAGSTDDLTSSPLSARCAC